MSHSQVNHRVEWMENHKNRTTRSWPAQSPDLSHLEILWNAIKKKMDGHKPSNKTELTEFLHQEWYKVTQGNNVKEW